MSDDESQVTHVIDSEKLILEVEKRPVLSNNKLKEYSDRNLKEKLWGEVCVNIVRNWNELSGTEKLQKGKEIQKKWKNLKDCFARELAAQRKLTSGKAAKKRRKYIYFDLLLFLLPYQQQRPTSSNITPLQGENLDEPEASCLPSPPNVENNKEDRSTPTIRHNTKQKNSPKSSVSSYEMSLLSILKAKQQEEIDEEKNFALMIVPMLAKLNDEQKHYAKVVILNVLRNAKYYTPPVVFQQPNVHLSNMVVQPTYSARRNQDHSSQILSPNNQYLQGLVSDTETHQRTPFPETPQLYNSESSSSAQEYYSHFSGELLSPTGTASTNDGDIYDLSNQ